MTNNWLDDYLREQLQGNLPAPDVEYGNKIHMDVQKYSIMLPMSTDLAMDTGIIPDTRPPSPPPTRRERFRWWRYGLRERIAIWVYERISDDKFPSECDW